LRDKQPSQRQDHPGTAHLERIGMVARWQPVHNGHIPVLRALCDLADRAIIGIGSANRHTVRNPFSLSETADMIRLVLAGRENYALLPIPDLDDGPRWRAMVAERFGPLDLFVTANPYVWSLLSAEYPLARPVELIPANARVAVDGTMVRREMARGGGWRALVPGEVADYIASRRLDERFRREFGLQTLAMDAIVQLQDLCGLAAKVPGAC
jgi:nicotinamide-nucleotide adenylyltransferase